MFSTLAADHIQNPRNRGRLEGATHRGVAGVPGDGPYCVLHLIIEDGVIRKATYETYGCPTSIAAGSLVVQLVTGRPVERALQLEPSDLLALMAPIPEGKEDCPPRAIAALRNALEEMI